MSGMRFGERTSLTEDSCDAEGMMLLSLTWGRELRLGLHGESQLLPRRGLLTGFSDVLVAHCRIGSTDGGDNRECEVE